MPLRSAYGTHKYTRISINSMGMTHFLCVFGKFNAYVSIFQLPKAAAHNDAWIKGAKWRNRKINMRKNDAIQKIETHSGSMAWQSVGKCVQTWKFRIRACVCAWVGESRRCQKYATHTHRPHAKYTAYTLDFIQFLCLNESYGGEKQQQQQRRMKIDRAMILCAPHLCLVSWSFYEWGV